MGYKVKWIEDHLGIPRKALRNYEAKGIMPPNEGGKDRDYTEDDIDRIWGIRLLQGMGFTVQEIADMECNEKLDFYESLAVKVKELEKRKEEIERLCGYAKAIKFTGRFPSRPKEMGSVTFQKFYEETSSEWNFRNQHQPEGTEESIDFMERIQEEGPREEDLDKLLKILENVQKMMTEDWVRIQHLYIKEVIKRKHNGTSDPEIQLLMQMLYENGSVQGAPYNGKPKSFYVRYEAGFYIYGDIARERWKLYGKENCEFIADAIAVFGGYNNYFEMDD